jgi:molybdate transport system regulatory protein
MLKISVRILCGDEIAMGPGKADLLDAIAAHGSISAAAMGMSYRRAWLLVDVMNRCWSGPLVATAPGNSRGTASRLTELGATVLAAYRALQQATMAAAGAGDAALERLLRAAPLPHQALPHQALPHPGED